MSLQGSQKAFKVILAFCLCFVVALFSILSISTNSSGILPFKMSDLSKDSIRSRLFPAVAPRNSSASQTQSESSNKSTPIQASSNSTLNDNGQDKAEGQGQVDDVKNDTDKSTNASVTTTTKVYVNTNQKQPTFLESCLSSKDLPNERLAANKEATTLDKVNEVTFGKLWPKTKEVTEMANRTIESIVTKRKSIKEAASKIDQTIMEMNLAIDFDDYRLLPGGHWIPLSCKPRWKVAIVVPFRNRFHHLPIFLRHIVPLLKRQKLEFSIFISEQRNDMRFNRAMLMNVGFVEALNFTDFDCVVFHDVDHLAINVKNYFGCEDMPRHFISGEAIWDWKIVYENLFGGVTGLTKEQFYAVNGLPNVYWGWGGEDDEFASRVDKKGLKRSRPKGEIGYFESVVHERKESSVFNEARFCLLKFLGQRLSTDGVSNLHYDQPTIELHPLYTNISVNIQRLPWDSKWTVCKGQ